MSSAVRRGNSGFFYRKDAEAQRFLLIFFLLCIGLQAQASKDSLDLKQTKVVKHSIISAGFGYPDVLFTVGNFPEKSIEGESLVGLQDLGTYYLRGERYDSKTKTSIGLTTFYSEQIFEYSTSGRRAKRYTINYKSMGLGFRVNSYFIDNLRFQAYLGLGFGGKIPLTKYSPKAPVFIELVAGLKFMPIKRFGLYLEVGPAKALSNLGVLLKF